MRILFFMRHPGYTRIFESALSELARRGHSIHVVLDSTRVSWLGTFNPLDPLTARFTNISYSAAPKLPKDARLMLSRGLRISLDYLRYLGPEYASAPKLRARAESKVPQLIRSFPGIRFRPVRAVVAWILRFFERCLPIRQELAKFIASKQPDVVLVTPLVAMGSTQVDYVRAARKLRLPTALCVTSWDNLTNKGLMHEIPDLVTVWNDPQRREAVQLHGVPPGRIEVTGAQCYDQWFEFVPSMTRDEFCRMVGLSAEKPIILYLCSSLFIAPKETRFVRRWLNALRSAGDPFSDAGVLVRPHPQNVDQWKRVDLGPQGVIWPPAGADPVTTDTKQAFFDSMYHASAVVGINTSAQIEAAIVGKVVHTVLAYEFRDTQRGTLHFEHIAGESGMLQVAADLDEHIVQLRTTLAREGGDQRTQAFVREFVRPRGVDAPATPYLADAIEALASQKPHRFRRALGARLVGPVLMWVARIGIHEGRVRERAHGDGAPALPAKAKPNEAEKSEARVPRDDGKGPEPANQKPGKKKRSKAKSPAKLDSRR